MWFASLGLLLASSYVQLMRDQQEVRELAERETAVSPHHLLFQVGSGCIHPTKAATRWATLPCAAALPGLPLSFQPAEGALQLILGASPSLVDSLVDPFLPRP